MWTQPSKLFILAGSCYQYNDLRRKLNLTTSEIHYFYSESQLRELRYPIIFLYGHYWDSHDFEYKMRVARMVEASIYIVEEPTRHTAEPIYAVTKL